MERAIYFLSNSCNNFREREGRRERENENLFKPGDCYIHFVAKGLFILPPHLFNFFHTLLSFSSFSSFRKKGWVEAKKGVCDEKEKKEVGTSLQFKRK